MTRTATKNPTESLAELQRQLSPKVATARANLDRVTLEYEDLKRRRDAAHAAGDTAGFLGFVSALDPVFAQLEEAQVAFAALNAELLAATSELDAQREQAALVEKRDALTRDLADAESAVATTGEAYDAVYAAQAEANRRAIELNGEERQTKIRLDGHRTRLSMRREALAKFLSEHPNIPAPSGISMPERLKLSDIACERPNARFASA